MTIEIPEQGERPRRMRRASWGGPTASSLGRTLAAHWPLAVFLILASTVGLLIVRRYGVSIDEHDNAVVGAEALRAYSGSRDYFALEALAEHGPAYFMLFSATSQAINRAFPIWSLADGRHMTNYLTFLIGVLCFYLICLRLVRPKYAFMASVLFATQPLFFGSGFINQKDIPFMTFFLAVLASGMIAVGVRPPWGVQGSAGPAESAKADAGGFARRIRADWNALSASRKRVLQAELLLAAVFLVDLAFVGLLRRLGQALVVTAYNGHALGPVQQLFYFVATDAYKTPVDLYLLKYDAAFGAFRQVAVVLLVASALFEWGRSLPSVTDLLRRSRSNAHFPALVVSAIFLGLAICVRQVGVFAGALASLCILNRGRIRGVLPLLLFWTIAGAVTWASWPYLWPDPIGRLKDSFVVIRAFDVHKVLFRGQLYNADALPWNYVPTLAALQLTEPALLLAAVGQVVMVRRMARRPGDWLLPSLLLMWVAVPLYWLITRHVPIYNNLRHVFFMLPPLFVCAGVGLESLAMRLRREWAGWVLFGLAILPGVLGIVRLHPYQYAYFNNFAGGVGGASGQYSLDYWCTSVKEATEVVDDLAAPESTLILFGPPNNAIPYVRNGLQIRNKWYGLSRADFVAICTIEFDARRDRIITGWDPSGFRRVYQVRRDGAVFAEVWQRQGGSAPGELIQ